MTETYKSTDVLMEIKLW